MVSLPEVGGLRARCPTIASLAQRVDQSHVRVRYRGAGFDDALMRQAEAILARGGMPLRGNQT